MKELKTQFSKWLKNNTTLAEKTISNYSGRICTISKEMVNEKIISKPFNEMNSEEIRQAISLIKNNSVFQEKDEKYNKEPSCSLNYFLQYIQSVDEKKCHQFNYHLLSSLFQTNISLRYIKSLLAKPFVILTGNSGTGKTRIARNFAKYMEVIDEKGEKNWLIVPVGADWTDNIKVLGFYNPLADNGKGKYEKTKILELIERANKNPNIPFFLVLDEMNLSHVERYFSDFLSHMERKDSEFELDGYEGKLIYPDNLFVVGTVNIDETTYMFSPKVLDRANVIEFKPNKGDVIGLFKEEEEKTEIEPVGDSIASAFLKLSREIRNGKYDVQNISQIDVTSRLTEVFGELYDKASEQGFEFAFRTVKEIKQYISAAYELQEDKSKFDLNQAIDEQIVQKILPKIHGNKKEIGNMLDKLEKLCNESNMTLSLNKIIQMRGKLDTVQYASFI